MKVLNTMLSNSARKMTTKFLRSLVKMGINPESDVCCVWGVENNEGNTSMAWETSTTRGMIDDNKQAHLLLRKLVGQNILQLYGVPANGREAPVVYLLPLPSLIKTIGITKLIKLVKSWPGNSIAMETEVVKYKVI